jgi:hypothetical protein
MSLPGDSTLVTMLKNELQRPWVVGRFRLLKQFAIQAQADELEKKFGGVPHELTPSRNLLDEAEQCLITQRGNIVGLERKLLKVIPYFLWTSAQQWSENVTLINAYLSWAEHNWRTAPRRLWRHYLLNMQPESLATQYFAHWLSIKADQLTPALRDFSSQWLLFEPEHAIAKIAGSLLAGDYFIDELGALKVNREALLKSACLLSAFKILGQRLRTYPHPSEITTTLKRLLMPLGDNPIHKMQGQNGLGEATQTALVEGLVIWANQDVKRINQTLDLLHVLIGDPRLYEPRWRFIDPGVRDTVERWLSKLTLDAFFQVMRELRTDRDDMVRDREVFWAGYKEKILNAWLITGTDGVNLATQLLNHSFGVFAKSNNARSDHLGLVLHVKNYVILEMNQNGRTLFWHVNDPNMPAFYEKKWFRDKLIDSCSAKRNEGVDRFYMAHTSSWQSKYENEILRRTGISRCN